MVMIMFAHLIVRMKGVVDFYSHIGACTGFSSWSVHLERSMQIV